MEVNALNELAFLIGGGETGQRIRTVNWSDSPVGAPVTWPQSLRTAVSILLNAHVPMFLSWGPSCTFLYNNAWSPLMNGAANAMGQNAREVLEQYWPLLEPAFRQAMQGKPITLYNTPLTVYRQTHSETSLFTLSFVPVLNEAGEVGGVMTTASEAPAVRPADPTKVYEVTLQLPLAVAILDPTDFSITAVNDLFLQVVHQQREAITGKPVFELLPETAQQPYPHLLKKLVQTGEPKFESNVPLQVVKNDKQATAWFNILFYPLRDTAGMLTGIVMMLREVTEWVVERSRIEKSETYFRRLADAIPVMLWMTHADGHCTYVNDRWAQYTGQAASDAVGQGWMQAVHPNDVEQMQAGFAAANRNRVPFYLEYRIKGSDGRYKWVLDSGIPTFNEQGQFEGFIGALVDIDERKQAEDAVREREMRFRQLADSMPQIVWTADPDGYVDYYNKQWYQFIGEENQFGDSSFLIHIHPDDQVRCIETWYRSVHTGQAYEIEYRFKVKHLPGQYRWFLVRAVPIKNEAGQVIKWYGTCTDINEVKSIRLELERLVAERTNEVSGKNKELEAQHIFVEAIFDASVDMIAVLDTELRFVSVNKKYQEVFEVKKQDVLGKKITDVFSEVMESPVLYGLEKALTGELVHHVTYRYPRINRDYETYFIPLRNPDEEIYSVVLMAHDNTEITRTTEELKQINSQLEMRNEELRQSEERYLRMTNEVEDYAIILLSRDGYIENWNKGAEKIKGYHADEIIGKHFSLFYTQEDQQKEIPIQLIKEAREKGKASYEGWRLRKDGSTFWGYTVITALHNDRNEVIGFSKVTRDLTERKLADDQLKMYAEQLEEKNRDLERSNSELTSFSYVASHDLQEPLRKIQAFGNLIQARDAANMSEVSRDYFDRMVKAAVRMQNLIDSLLEFSRTATGRKNFESTDLNVILDDVKKELADRIDEKKAVINASVLPTLAVIPFQFRQLLLNLLNNSLKYAKAGEPPVIDIKADLIKAADMKEKAAVMGKDYYRFTITDNGIGFEQEYAEKIFELFQRLHGRNEYNGSGIGLAICKKIVENHHGFIRAESGPDKGAAFYFFIPSK
jgi:PAS domain S-box-containing protein